MEHRYLVLPLQLKLPLKIQKNTLRIIQHSQWFSTNSQDCSCLLWQQEVAPPDGGSSQTDGRFDV